jgi:hypothetical protein
MGWRMPVSSELSIRLRCRKPFGEECSHAAVRHLVMNDMIEASEDSAALEN